MEKKFKKKKFYSSSYVLKSKDLIEIINPEMHNGRLYRLTSVGEEIVENLIRI